MGVNMSKGSGKKRKRDQFSVTIVGIVIYSILLIGIVAGTYLGIKTFYTNHLKKIEAAVTETEEEIENRHKAEAEAAISEKEAEAEEPAEETVEPEQLPERLLDVTSVINRDTMEIDYSQIVATPEKRNPKYAWNEAIFAKLEDVRNPADSPVNTYDFSRKYAVVDGDKKLEFMIYTNPETEKAEKITTKEYCGDDVEVLNYYYDNGNINYVSQYRQTVDIPINPSTKNVQGRYYFSGDTMVKYVFCEDDKATEYRVADMDQYSEGTVSQYDYLEADILNKA